jgi:phage shock protein A
LSQRKLTVQDIILMQKQLEAAQHLNNLLGEAVAEIGEAVGSTDPASVNNQDAAAVLNKVRKVISELEEKVEEFNKRLR